MPRKSEEKRVEMKVDKLGIDILTRDPVVILKTANEDIDGKRFLPIVIGYFEATSIAYVLEKEPVPRPLTHDLLVSVIKKMGGILTEVVITKVENDTFHAIAVIIRKGKKKPLIIDSRPSDVIAAALRVKGCKIFVNNSLLIKEGRGKEKIYRLKLEEVEEETKEKSQPNEEK